MINESHPSSPVRVTLLSVSEVRAIVGMGRTKLYGLIADGEFPAPSKIGSSSRWRSDDIEAWIDRVTGRAA